VFVPAARAAEVPRSDLPADRFRDLRNANTALNVFDFASFVGDFETAWSLLDLVEGRLSYQAPTARLETARDYRAAYAALRDRHYDRALAPLQRGLANRPVSDRDRAILTLLLAMDKLRGEHRETEIPPLEAALDRLKTAKAEP